MSTGRTSIFRTLLWAESAPRRKVLRIIACILVLFAASSVMTYSSLYELDTTKSLGTEFVHGETLVIAGILYALLVQGVRGFTVQPPWLAMALPVRTYRLLIPTLFYQTRVALLLGAVFGIQRYFADVEHAFTAPVAILTALSAQGYAACLWWTAGQARGLAVFGVAFACASLIGVAAAALTPVPALITAAVFLIPCGWVSSYLAAQAIRGGNVPSVDFARIALMARFLEWNQVRAANKTEFSSPFWAQVWFEWRRTGWWLAGGFVLFSLAISAINFPYILVTGSPVVNLDELPGVLTTLYVVLPVLVWLAHLAITKPYRRFVFTRPITTKRVAAAKMLAALAAAVVIAVIENAVQGFNGAMLPGDTVESAPGPLLAFVDSIVSNTQSVGMTALALLYGPILFIAMMFSMFIWALEEIPMEGLTWDWQVLIVVPIALPMLVIGVLPLAFVYMGVKKRIDTLTYPRPLEVIVSLTLLAIVAAFALVEQAIAHGVSLRSVLVYAGPVVLLLSILCYGLRAEQLTMRQAGAIFLAFALSWFVLWANQLAAYSGEPDMWSNTRGFWLAVAFSVFVLYPIMVGCQRLETERTTSSGVPAWAMFFFAPLVGIAFLFLGEDWSEGRERT